MNRLQKKCFIASTGLHVLLVVMLFLGSAFTHNSRMNEISDLNFEPTILTDSNLQGGGNPNAGRPPAPHHETPPAPPPPAPPIKHEVVKEEKKEEVKSKKVEDPTPLKKEISDSLEVSKTKKKFQINTNLITLNSVNKEQAAKAKAAKAAAEQRAADQARRARQDAISDAMASLGNSGSSATHIMIGDNGPGGGGPSYGGYDSWVKKVYMENWAPPNDPSKDSALTAASITILRDGTVADYKIVSRSGDHSVDASVQKTLERVRTVGRPFPDSSKDSKRTYILEFDLKAKRGVA